MDKESDDRLGRKFKNMIDLLSDRFVFCRQFVAYGGHGTTPFAADIILKMNKKSKPFFEVLPCPDFQFEGELFIAKLFKKILHHGMDQVLFAFEIMVKLTFPGAGLCQDFINTRGVDTLLVKKLKGCLKNF